ncbi:MAG TPA: VIT domain-containing protein [Pirellulales bacterium]|nr:VIT domain-containing protein [Pirellulales bacterium]
MFLNIKKSAFGASCLLLASCWLSPARLRADSTAADQAQAEIEKDVTQGALRVAKPDGTVVECPLKHTEVNADISGFVARVNVKQTFHNPLKEKIEAVYVFPLPHTSAVDAMTMTVGDRRIVGLIKRRAEARKIYDQALLAGQTAALLEQERPNIFTQSVGNIAPGQEVVIEISYVDVLEYDLGSYEFRFPMVVGPRYNPGSATSSPSPLPAELQGKTSGTTPDTTRVPDASRINPPVLKPGHRSGHDISLAVKLDAGVPVQDLSVANHKADVQRADDRQAKVVLSPDDRLPNKDFVLRYKVSGKKPELALLAHTDASAADAGRVGSGYFMLMIQPREDERLTKSPPREMVFLVDVSGSMSGQPTAKVIEAMQNMLKLCRAVDTVQVITFAGDAHKLFPQPVPVNAASIGRALNFTEGLQGAGGTEMLKGVKLAIDEPLDKERMRIVVMLTDGYIGNEAEIIEHVGKQCGDRIRFWCLGIGSSPNMFLVDGVARQGGGMGRTLGLDDETAGLTEEIMTRIQRAQLAKVRIDYGGLQVSQTYPARLPELWAGRPVVVYGRYAGSGDSLLTVSGEVEGEPTSWQLAIKAPQDEPAHDVLAKVWARQKIEDLMQQTYYQGSPAVEEEVTGLALQYRLMSPYTSFVAVDSDSPPAADSPRPPRRMLVPVPLPEGTRWEGFFGPEGDTDGLLEARQLGLAPAGTAGGLGGLRSDSFSFEAKKSADARYYRAMTPAGGGATALRAALGRGLAGPVGAGGRRSGRMAGKPVAAAAPIAVERSKLVKQLRESIVADFEIRDLKEDEGQRVLSLAAVALGEQSGPLNDAAQAALDAARTLQKAGQLSDAGAQLAWAWLLASATGNSAKANEAMDALEAVHRDWVHTATKRVPALDKRLDLVVRDQAIDVALDAVAKAAGMQLRLLPGSLDDAKLLTGDRGVRVSFLDLREATVTEALDWLLSPERLDWWLDGDTIVAGTARRRPGGSAWVYDVASMVFPAEEELTGDESAKMATYKKAADDFIAAVRKHLGAAATSVAWLAPGQAMLFGDAALHDRAGRLFAALADSKARLPADLTELHKKTAKRAGAREAENAQQLAARRRHKTALAHVEFDWQLLRSAFAGQLDLEAMSELNFAWRQPETAELLQGAAKAIVVRSLWTLAEADRMLPNEAELKKLIGNARKLCQPAVEDAVATLKKSPDDAGAFTAVLYAALADRDDAAAAGSLLDLLAPQAAKSPESKLAYELARAIVSDPADVDRAMLIRTVRGDLAGEDLVTLAALACCRAGGDTWQAFRAESQRLLGSQPLPSNVVVLVNQLDRADNPLRSPKH